MTAPAGESPRRGLRVPAEWEPRAGTLLAWPPEHSWMGSDGDVLATMRELIALLRAREPVWLLVPPEEKDAIARALGGEDSSLRLEPFYVNDLWMRDAGPISALEASATGEGEDVVFIDAGFNGWGRKFPHEMDALIPTMLARRWGVRRARASITAEGGAIESNGRGDLLTTESVLLNPNRGAPDKRQVEEALRREFGAERVHWLGGGLAGDDTDGHIDNLARFAGPSRVACTTDDVDPARPDAPTLADNRRRLAALRGPEGPFEVVDLPAPEVKTRRGARLPASYANFYLAPDLVIAPTFGDNEDDRALGVLRELFPNRRVAGLEARPLLAEGGTFHCVTQPLQTLGNAPCSR